MTPQTAHTVSALPMPPSENLPQAGPNGDRTRNLGVYLAGLRPTLRRPDATGELPAMPVETAAPAAPADDPHEPAEQAPDGLAATLLRFLKSLFYRGEHRYGRATWPYSPGVDHD